MRCLRPINTPDLTLDSLRALAAVNPFRWENLTRNEILERCAAAGLDLPRGFTPTPGPPGTPGTGKSIVTSAVIRHVSNVDLDFGGLLHSLLTAGGERRSDGERLTFEVIETMAAYASRFSLESVALAARPDTVETAAPHRAM